MENELQKFISMIYSSFYEAYAYLIQYRTWQS